MRKQTFVHVTHSISRAAGGLFESVRHLSQGVQRSTQAEVLVLALEDERSAVDAAEWKPLAVSTHPVLGPQKFGYSPALNRKLKHANPDLVHLHGLWKYPSLAVWRWARQTNRPLIISPHGMLEPWALHQSKTQKLVANLLYQRACLQIAKCIRATSAQELTSIRQAGFRNPVALVPNGVELPHLPPRPNPEPTIAKRRRVLFLSRIHPKKGLLNLVEAWSTLRPRHWELLIVGPVEVGHLAEVQRAVASHALQDSVSFGGPVWGESRNAVYQSADLFVLPSFSENFGLVIAEALANGLPVITTHATPWRELSEHHCGWWSDVGIAPLIESLKEAFAMSAAELRQMGNRGRKLIESQYAWEPLGLQMAAVYEWMLGGPRPSCLIND